MNIVRKVLGLVILFMIILIPTTGMRVYMGEKLSLSLVSGVAVAIIAVVAGIALLFGLLLVAINLLDDSDE